MKVYLTSRGSYSDYELDRVFASEVLAKDYLAFYAEAHDYGGPNEEIVEAEVVDAPMTARKRYEMSSTWYEKPDAHYSWAPKVGGWTEPYERVQVQILGEEAAVYGDDPRQETHTVVNDDRGQTNDYLIRYGCQVAIRVAGWDQERVRKVFGEVKAQKAAEIAGL